MLDAGRDRYADHIERLAGLLADTDILRSEVEHYATAHQERLHGAGKE
ncbi:MAG: hypothetical protein DI625_14840 [Sphingomonas sp.]|nr:MAG: hypothetical protein DI625_14840 [Sphingomonas sp.]